MAALGGLAAAGAAAGILFAASPWSDEPEPAATEESAAETPSTTLRVMTFNIFYGGDELDLATDDWCTRPAGCQETLAQVVAAIEAADADIVGLQEPTVNTRTIAERLGWHASERTHVISRFPILDGPVGDEHYVYVEVEPGRMVAVSNNHLPSTPYGPYRLRDGASGASASTSMSSLRRRLFCAGRTMSSSRSSALQRRGGVPNSLSTTSTG